jgi:hypothetical protein
MPPPAMDPRKRCHPVLPGREGRTARRLVLPGPEYDSGLVYENIRHPVRRGWVVRHAARLVRNAPLRIVLRHGRLTVNLRREI